MCLPCFPWTWTEYEDPLDSMPEQHVWMHDGQAWSLQRCVSVISFLSFLSSFEYEYYIHLVFFSFSRLLLVGVALIIVLLSFIIEAALLPLFLS